MPTEDSTTTLSLPDTFVLACKMNGPLRFRATHRITGVEQSFTVNSSFVFVGRSPVAGIRLDDPTVSQCHAYLQVIEGAVFCTDIGSRAGVTWDNGNQGRGWFNPNQTLRIGNYDLRVESIGETPVEDSLDGEQDLDPACHKLSLAFVEIHSAAQNAEVLHRLDRPITLLGRHPTCDLRLLDASIAYFQCALVNTNHGVWFVDTMSRNGALLNGRNTRFSRLRDGDLLEIGKLSFVLRIGADSKGGRIALRETSASSTAVDTMANITGKVAEAVAGALAPVGDMMNQFQHCFLTMTQMFTSMQKEHSMMVSEQMRHIQELAGELRVLRAQCIQNGALVAANPSLASPGSPPPDHSPAAATKPLAPSHRAPTINLPTSDTEAQTLSNAHTWFMTRLATKDLSNPSAS